MFRDRWKLLMLASALLIAPTAALAEDALTIVSPAKFKDGIVVRDAIKAECKLLTKVPAYIKDYAEKNAKVTLAETAGKGKGKTLRVQIENVGEAGGAGPGPKSLTIRGELHENGKLVGTITATRTTMGGPFGFGGVCRNLHRCAKTLGKDLAGWIEEPAMDVKLQN